MTTKKGMNNYSNECMEIIELMSFDNTTINIEGSSSLKNILYPSDIDLQQFINCSPNDAVKELQNIVSRTINKELVYIIDIKCGVYDKYKVINDDILTNYTPKIYLDKLQHMANKKVITKTEYKQAISLLIEKPNEEQLLYIQNEIRYHIIRWKPYEILEGYKFIRGNVKVKLIDAIITGLTKLDVIAYLNTTAKYIEFSNIFHFDFVKSENTGNLRDDIKKYFTDKNYFKMAKRMFSVSLMDKKLKSHGKDLLAIFNGELGILYNVINDCRCLLSLLEHINLSSYTKINTEIDGFKVKLSNIHSTKTYLLHEQKINNIINLLVNTPKEGRNKKLYISKLNKLIDSLETVLNTATLSELRQINLIPIPEIYQSQ